MLTVIVWWLWIQIMGLAALPLVFRFFRRLPDRGYAFARPLGLLLATYVLWMAGALGLLRNSVGGALFSILVVAGVSVVVYRRGRAEGEPGLIEWLRTHVRMVLAVELLFIAALGLWSLLRAYSPELTTAGGEKFMEIMFLNSIGRSEYFPPHDAWLSGYGISYYYFGYVMVAMLTRLAGLPAHLTFNVGLASLFALTCTGAFSLVYNMVKGVEQSRVARDFDKGAGKPANPIAWGFLGSILVAVMGNLEGFLEVLYSGRLLPEGFWRWLDIKDINEPFTQNTAASLVPTRSGWWWWRASRVIHDLDPNGDSIGVQPIDEFPGFSFLLGDMHAHVLALPFVLLVLAVALNALLSGHEDSREVEASRELKGIAGWLEPLRRLPLLVPLCLGALGFLNTWDFPIYWVAFVVAYGLGRWDRYGKAEPPGGVRVGPFLRDVGVTGAAVAFFGIVLYLPFYIGFQSQAGGLLPTIYVGTRFRQFFVMFGPFLVAVVGLLFLLLNQLRRGISGKRLFRSWMGWLAAFLVFPLAMMFLIVFVLVLTPQGSEMLDSIRQFPAVYDIVGDEPWISLLGRLFLVKLRTWVMPLVVAGMSALAVVLLRYSAFFGPPSPARDKSRLHPIVHFVLLCIIMGLLLTLSVEFFYLVDNFRVRANTIFKFYFQAWILLAIGSAFAVYWLSRRTGETRRGESIMRMGFLIFFWVLFAMAMVYPVLGNVRRAGDFAQPPTLDGTAYLAQGQADDYAAIAWLNEQVEGAPVILEAPGTGGSSYVYEGRVSALTGLPTLLGWAGHEGQWRGSYEVQHAREPDIETIYNSFDPEVASRLLDKYDVSYVYVGPLEQSKYDPRALEKFERFMDVVYEENGVAIYKSRK